MPTEKDDKTLLLDELQVLRSRVNELEEKLELCDGGSCRPLVRFSHTKSNFFRSLIDAIPDLVWIKDPQGVYLACNEAFELFFGADESEIIGKTDYDFVDRELGDFFRLHDKMAMEADGPSINEEWLTIAATGKRQLVETIKTPVRNEDGALIGILGIARNITDRKLAEDELKKRMSLLTQPSSASLEVEFADLFDINDTQRLQDEFSAATGVAAIITQPDGTPITRPSNFCRFCNIIRGTEKGRANCRKSDAELGQPKSDGPSIQTCRSGGLWDAGAAITVGGRHVANWLIGQVRNERQDEDEVRLYAREIGADEAETVRAFLEVPPMSAEKFSQISKVLFTLTSQLSDIAYQNIRQARFIHELTNTEAELARTRNYLSNIINSMPSILVGVDAMCRVTLWNREAEKATGIPARQAEGQPLSFIMPRMAPEIEKIESSIQSRIPRADYLQIKTDAGETMDKSITTYPLISNGVEGAVVRVDDVTERIKMEKMMVQSEKMMSIGGLAAGMAHEINNPLAGILGYVNNIERRIFKDSDKSRLVASETGVSLENLRAYLRKMEIPRMLDGIHASGTRAARIVYNMLSFSRKSESRFMNHDIKELLDNTLELAANDYDLKKSYDFRAIEIVREYDEDIPPVFCERNELQQVFLNLFKNGAEAMVEKKYVDDRPRFTCRVRLEEDMVVVQIEDNGPGMDARTRERIFEPFFTTKVVGKGTGLGLSVSYFIITDHHDGVLEVDSVLGDWTCFTIRLPLGKHSPKEQLQG